MIIMNIIDDVERGRGRETNSFLERKRRKRRKRKKRI